MKLLKLTRGEWRCREPIADLSDGLRRHFPRLILANLVKGRVSATAMAQAQAHRK